MTWIKVPGKEVCTPVYVSAQDICRMYVSERHSVFKVCAEDRKAIVYELATFFQPDAAKNYIRGLLEAIGTVIDSEEWR